MPKNPPDEAPEQLEPTTDLAYESPPELDDEDGGGKPPRSLALKLAAIAALVLVVGGGLLAYRAHHRRKVIEAALTQADALLRLDTAAGYRQAANLLEPIAQLDPMAGASVRAFALAMLFADYRQADAEGEVENLLVTPMRAENVPSHAQLAVAALALGRKEAGTASSAVSRAGEGPWPRVIQARVAFLAGNLDAALESAASAAAEGAFAPGLALHGDALRRLHRDRDRPAARAAYEAALAASPANPRATFGLAKLALSGDAPAEEAETALRRLLDDREGTPAVERGRAAVHLAALRLRAGDRTSADAALETAGLDATARAWANRAAVVAAEHRGAYRAVQGAPPPLQSASDDDPGELSPIPPPPPPPPPAPAAAVKKGPAAKKAALAAKKAAAKKSAAKKAGSKASKKPAGKKAKKAVRT